MRYCHFGVSPENYSDSDPYNYFELVLSNEVEVTCTGR